MKRLSICLPALTLVLTLLCSAANPITPISTPAFRPSRLHPDPALITALRPAILPAPAVHPPLPATPFVAPIPAKDFQLSYYWYLAPDDIYNDYATLSQEAWEWWVYLGGVEVDTNPVGGTLLEWGYQNNSYPHMAFPTIYLYAHYTY